MVATAVTLESNAATTFGCHDSGRDYLSAVLNSSAQIECAKPLLPLFCDVNEYLVTWVYSTINSARAAVVIYALAEVDFGLLEFTPANKDEGLPLPQFVRDVINAKGIPLTNNVSLTAPDVSGTGRQILSACSSSSSISR